MKSNEINRRRFFGKVAVASACIATLSFMPVFGNTGDTGDTADKSSVLSNDNDPLGPIRDVETTAKLLPEFPKFEYRGIVLGYENLKHLPHNDLCQVSVFPAYKYLDQPLGKYYAYYSSHDGPGGICLAYADDLEGPWTECDSSPLFTNEWEPHYKVSHISGPDAIWIEKEKKVFVYYHGENQDTRFASSSDGIHFEYEGVAASLRDHGFSSLSYARVANFTMPGHSIRYIMLCWGVDKSAGMVYLATSVDGRTWAPSTTPLIPLPPGTGVGGPACYLRWDNRNFIITMGNLKSVNNWWEPISNIYLYELDELLQNPKFQGVLLDRGVLAPEHQRFSTPCIFEEDEKIHMFFSVGKRLNEKMGYAVADKGIIK